MNKSLVLASVAAVIALAACGKKEEVAAPLRPGRGGRRRRWRNRPLRPLRP